MSYLVSGVVLFLLLVGVIFQHSKPTFRIREAEKAEFIAEKNLMLKSTYAHIYADGNVTRPTNIDDLITTGIENFYLPDGFDKRIGFDSDIVMNVNNMILVFNEVLSDDNLVVERFRAYLRKRDPAIVVENNGSDFTITAPLISMLDHVIVTGSTSTGANKIISSPLDLPDVTNPDVAKTMMNGETYYVKDSAGKTSMYIYETASNDWTIINMSGGGNSVNQSFTKILTSINADLEYETYTSTDGWHFGMDYLGDWRQYSGLNQDSTEYQTKYDLPYSANDGEVLHLIDGSAYIFTTITNEWLLYNSNSDSNRIMVGYNYKSQLEVSKSIIGYHFSLIDTEFEVYK